MTKFSITGMKCESCVAKISNALKNAGIFDATVTFNPPQLTLSSSSSTAAQLNEIVRQAGEYKVLELGSAPASSQAPTTGEESLRPLLVILGYIVGGVLVHAFMAKEYAYPTLMNNFMGAFFIVFSMFKLLNLSGFAEAYATYDIVAARSRLYAMSYPFIELLLGLAYFTNFAPLTTNLFTLGLMTVGSIGVANALRSKRKFQCACLGTALKLPMTKVTLVEDVTMGLMALVMIVHMWGL